MTLPASIAVVVAAVVVTLAVLALVLWMLPARADRSVPVPESHPRPRSFRFRQGYLVSANAGVGFLLPDPVDPVTAWDDLAAALAEMVPGIEDALDDLNRTGRSFHLEGRFGRDRLHVVGLRDREIVHVGVATVAQGDDAIALDREALLALEGECALLMASQDAAPTLSWALDEDGRVVWGNARYRATVSRHLGVDPSVVWPLPALFPFPVDAPAGSTRRDLDTADGTKRFEVTLAAPRDGLRHAHAQPLGRLLEVETALRGTIETLTHAFAAMPLGVAVFDTDRRLLAHNPGLTTITGLDAGWLTGRPGLGQVLDRMRDAGRLPDLHDPVAWRDRLLMTGETRDGSGVEPWSETWTLADGQSLRMNVRTLPAGAIVLLLEDMTRDVALARTRRDERSTLAAVLDTSPDGVAAFDADGRCLHANGSLRRLCGLDEVAAPALAEVIDRLSERGAPRIEVTDGTARAFDRRFAWPGAHGADASLRLLPLADGAMALRVTLPPNAGPTVVRAAN
ncbi:PAS domain-containing protein [Jannaschia sp. LMIT008]|uniref:PAS domain-containing protein n=1 Tax=Jannaschia maritima TaxID=3032585 RepID=UPI002810BC2B|nr:PAS domain-containing protein [Jannaschia sp. LMIT008]